MTTLATLLEFERITGKNIRQFFRNALNFFQSGYPLLAAYYAGSINSVKSDPFAVLTALEQDIQILFTAFQTHSVQLTNSRWWFLLEDLEELDNRLKTCRNIARWSRSTRSNTGFLDKTESSYTLPAGQTLERISGDMLKDSLPEDDWMDIALRNNLREEDYSIDGGVNLRLSLPSAGGSVKVNTVVDVMEGRNILGKDLHRAMRFTDNDLAVLSPDETVVQSVDILAALKNNDNPYAPNDGLQTAVILGGNRASLNFPVISRQMSRTFASDDTLTGFTIKELKVENDNLLINYEVSTRLNETIDASITL
ncbi:hypothetical protein [Chitinophaga sp. CB10]|uniref:hypothetical protein n=1 Tax=Chitinophaga sp. CB10 TaxID=1891659 RepID=UPI0025BF90FF|nr:hypothetical protein [Chitinophaga sp. CB10]